MPSLTLIIVGTKYFLSDPIQDKLEQVSKETADELIELGTPVINALQDGLDDLGEGLREGLESLGGAIEGVGRGLGSASLDLAENIGVALLKAGANTRNYIVDEIGDRRVTFVKQFTILIIVLMTTVFVYNQLMMKDR
tara:strand:+ start:4039 stop:4452 length:414 start_codon:yes stop_codon:yes gene_type:complete